jgi:hypothetical protein
MCRSWTFDISKCVATVYLKPKYQVRGPKYTCKNTVVYNKYKKIVIYFKDLYKYVTSVD